MDGIVQGGVNSAPYNITVTPWTEEHGARGSSCFRAIAKVMCPCFLPAAPFEIEYGEIKCHVIETRNNLTVRVRNELGNTDPDAAQQSINRLRERLTADETREFLAAARSTAQGPDRRQFLIDIIEGYLQANVASDIFEPPETESEALPYIGESQHEIPSYDDLPEYIPAFEQIPGSRFCDISHEKDASDMVFYNKHFYRYDSLVKNNELNGGADPYRCAESVNWGEVYKVVPEDQIEVHDNKAFDSDEGLSPYLQITKL